MNDTGSDVASAFPWTLTFTALRLTLQPLLAQFSLTRLLWQHLPWWSVLPVFVALVCVQLSLCWFAFCEGRRRCRRVYTFYEPRIRASRTARVVLWLFRPLIWLLSERTATNWVFEESEPVLRDGHWWLPCKASSTMYRVSPTTLQLLASAPPKSTLEAYMPGSITIRAPAPASQAQLQMFENNNWTPVGECFRVSWKGKTADSANYLVLPAHVLVSGRHYQVVRGDKVAPLDLTTKCKQDGCLAFYSSVNNFDILVLNMPEAFFSLLGLKAAKLGLYQIGAARIFGRLGKEYTQSTGDLTTARRTHRINHTASTEPGWSGAPIFQYNCIVGMHQGYNPASDVDPRAFNRALDVYSIFRNVLGLPEITQKQESPWELRQHFRQLEDEEKDFGDTSDDRRFVDWQSETILAARGDRNVLQTYREGAAGYYLQDWDDQWDQAEHEWRERQAAQSLADGEETRDPLDLSGGLDAIDEAYRLARDLPYPGPQAHETALNEPAPSAPIRSQGKRGKPAPAAPVTRPAEPAQLPPKTAANTSSPQKMPQRNDSQTSGATSRITPNPRTSPNVVIPQRGVTQAKATTNVEAAAATQSWAQTSTLSCGSVTTTGGQASTPQKGIASPRADEQTSDSQTPPERSLSRNQRKRQNKLNRDSANTNGQPGDQKVNESAFFNSTRPSNEPGRGPEGKWVISGNGQMNFIPAALLPSESDSRFVQFTTRRDAEFHLKKQQRQEMEQLRKENEQLRSQQGLNVLNSPASSACATSWSATSSATALQAAHTSGSVQELGPTPTSSSITARS
nr:MAG: hypothetical protein 1 [Sobelivirales sp.]